MATRAEKLALNALVGLCESEQEKNHVSMAKFFDDLFTVFCSNTQESIPQFVESSYTGIHLNDTYEEGKLTVKIYHFVINCIIK